MIVLSLARVNAPFYKNANILIQFCCKFKKNKRNIRFESVTDNCSLSVVLDIKYKGAFNFTYFITEQFDFIFAV